MWILGHHTEARKLIEIGAEEFSLNDFVLMLLKMIDLRLLTHPSGLKRLALQSTTSDT
jgi:hypothetical protein